MLAYQTVLLCFKEDGIRDLEVPYNGLNVNISHLFVLYYDNIVLYLGVTDEKQETIFVN